MARALEAVDIFGLNILTWHAEISRIAAAEILTGWPDA
jgi:hypothetical protein